MDTREERHGSAPNNNGTHRSALDSAPNNKSAHDDERGLRFDDPYWDDAFCAWLDPTMRTCCA